MQIHDGQGSSTNTAADTYNDLLLAIFLGVLWAVGRALNRLGIAPLAGLIIAGSVLGPPLLKAVPFSSALSQLGAPDNLSIPPRIVETAAPRIAHTLSLPLQARLDSTCW